LTISVEETHVDSVVLVAIPVEDGLESFISIVAVSILRRSTFNWDVFTVGVSLVFSGGFIVGIARNWF